jgi:hypothetical protein
VLLGRAKIKPKPTCKPRHLTLLGSFMQADDDSYRQRLWTQAAETDTPRLHGRNVVEKRECESAAAFVRGLGAAATNSWKRRLPPNQRQASYELVANSRRLLDQSRRLIIKSENALAFSRVWRKAVN